MIVNYKDYTISMHIHVIFHLKYYQVSIKAIETVPCVRVIVRLGLPVANVVHNLVLSLTRNLPSDQQSIFLSPSITSYTSIDEGRVHTP